MAATMAIDLISFDAPQPIHEYFELAVAVRERKVSGSRTISAVSSSISIRLLSYRGSAIPKTMKIPQCSRLAPSRLTEAESYALAQ